MLRLFDEKEKNQETAGKIAFYFLAKSNGKSIGFQKSLKECTTQDQLNTFCNEIENEFLIKKTEHPDITNIDTLIQFEGVIKGHEVKFTFGDMSFFKTCMQMHFEPSPSPSLTK